MKNISIIVATSENNVIGCVGKIPWHISADLKRFKELTTGHTIIMGRKTWDSLPIKPLPNRQNIVLTKNPDFVECENTHKSNSVENILTYCKKFPDEEVFIIGGEQIYEQFLPFADKIYLTYVKLICNGDTYFGIKETEWESIQNDSHFDEKSHLYYQFETLVRR